MTIPLSLQKIKTFLKKFPGVGERTAERFAFDLLRWNEEEIKKFSHLLSHFHESVTSCPSCGALQEETCPFCANPTRSKAHLAIVPTPREIFSLESTRCFTGLYHVLGGYLSPLDPPLKNEEKILRLKKRIQDLQVKEIFLAFDATLEGDATAHYIKHELQNLELHFTRPAFGLPVGSPLEGIDMGTLTKAFLARCQF